MFLKLYGLSFGKRIALCIILLLFRETDLMNDCEGCESVLGVSSWVLFVIALS
jgi:hypothetical protein